MNATSRDEIRAGGKSREIVDEKMDQVRELLVGEDLRRADARFAAIEERLREIEALVGRKLDAMSARLDAMAGEMTAEHRGSFDELARCVASLGEEIRRIGKR